MFWILTMLSYAHVWEVHLELMASQWAGIIPTPQASDEEVEVPEPLQRSASFYQSKPSSGRPWHCAKGSDKFQYPSPWLHTCQCSNTVIRNVNRAMHLATAWPSKWTESQNQSWLLGECFLVSREPHMCCSMHAKKVTTAEYTKILLKLVRAFFFRC